MQKLKRKNCRKVKYQKLHIFPLQHRCSFTASSEISLSQAAEFITDTEAAAAAKVAFTYVVNVQDSFALTVFGLTAVPVGEPIKCKYFCPVDFVDLSGRMEHVAVSGLFSWQGDPVLSSRLRSKQNLSGCSLS